MYKGIIYDVQLSSNADIEFLQITPTFDSRKFTSMWDLIEFAVTLMV